MRQLQVCEWDLDRIRLYSRRLRKNDAAVVRMVRSIEAYGFCVPVLVTAEGEVIDGELRVKAARQMGWTRIPVLMCDEWTPEQVRGFRLMANQSSNWAQWDLAAVAVELAELQAQQFAIDLTGFGEMNLDLNLDLGESGVHAKRAEGERAVCGECGRRVRS
jgi:ParB-like chromosome segregation protein Spo0J